MGRKRAHALAAALWLAISVAAVTGGIRGFWVTDVFGWTNGDRGALIVALWRGTICVCWDAGKRGGGDISYEDSGIRHDRAPVDVFSLRGLAGFWSIPSSGQEGPEFPDDPVWRERREWAVPSVNYETVRATYARRPEVIQARLLQVSIWPLAAVAVIAASWQLIRLKRTDPRSRGFQMEEMDATGNPLPPVPNDAAATEFPT